MYAFLRGKKGFTLVELMIVVVIMAILVAVAIPVFAAVTERAEVKTCHTNIKIISSLLQNYQNGLFSQTSDPPMSFDGLTISLENGVAKYEGTDDASLREEWLAPKIQGSTDACCPTDGVITVTENSNGSAVEVVVTCSKHGGVDD